MVDRMFADESLAALYDPLCAGRRDVDFYLPLVGSAHSVLDVGCGTGELLHRAREVGHRGRLCGIDPAPGMLAHARAKAPSGPLGVEWVLGDLQSAGWDREFDLAVMTGNAFQVFVADEEVRGVLRAVRAALVDGGRFAFETRNPLARAWEGWTPEHAVEVVAPDGARVRAAHQVEAVNGETVSFTTTFTSPSWPRPRFSRSTLRFPGARAISAFLADAGLVVDEQYGDWDRQPLTDASPNIITIARRR